MVINIIISVDKSYNCQIEVFILSKKLYKKNDIIAIKYKQITKKTLN